jgi:tetraacyldisaccharide 4'-kinase
MNKLIQNVQAVMTGEKDAGPLLHFLLMILSMLYGIIVKLRMILYDQGVFQAQKLPCTVISIGNLTVGGTGKTPMTIYLAELLKGLGYQPAVISRGYKGLAEKKGGVVSDMHEVLLSPEVAGDEPFMMAQKLKNIPVLVGADRFCIGMKAMEKFSPDIIIFDDAFQHRRLKRDLDIVMIDDKSFLGNRYLLPRGILREPISGISRSDLFVLTRCNDNSSNSLKRLGEMVPGKPVFKSFHEPYVCGIFNGTDDDAADRFSGTVSRNFDFLKKSKVFVFSGIAKNGDFQITVEHLAEEVLGAIGFKDHHQYTESDFRLIIAKAQKASAAFLVTTEKDYVKIAGKMKSPLALVVVGIRVSFKQDAMKFSEFIKNQVDHIVQ